MLKSLIAVKSLVIGVPLIIVTLAMLSAGWLYAAMIPAVLWCIIYTFILD